MRSLSLLETELPTDLKTATLSDALACTPPVCWDGGGAICSSFYVARGRIKYA
jgi:hypothetical protein